MKMLIFPPNQISIFVINWTTKSEKQATQFMKEFTLQEISQKKLQWYKIEKLIEFVCIASWTEIICLWYFQTFWHPHLFFLPISIATPSHNLLLPPCSKKLLVSRYQITYNSIAKCWGLHNMSMLSSQIFNHLHMSKLFAQIFNPASCD